MTWWRHQMETFSALLVICAGNSSAPGEFPAQRPVTRSFDVFFDLQPNKRLSKQWWCWWFETLSCPLWRHRNDVHRKHCSTHFEIMPSYLVNSSIWSGSPCLFFRYGRQVARCHVCGIIDNPIILRQTLDPRSTTFHNDIFSEILNYIGKYMHDYIWYVNTHLCTKFNGRLAKQPLKVEYEWVIISYFDIFKSGLVDSWWKSRLGHLGIWKNENPYFSSINCPLLPSLIK